MEEQTIYKSGAKRNNKGKLRFDLIPPEVEKIMAEVLTKGAEKYGDRNWEKGMPHLDYIGSCKRHINSYLLGEDIDPQLQVHNIGCAIINLSMLYHHIIHYPELDNRPNKHKANQLKVAE